MRIPPSRLPSYLLGLAGSALPVENQDKTIISTCHQLLPWCAGAGLSISAVLASQKMLQQQDLIVLCGSYYHVWAGSCPSSVASTNPMIVEGEEKEKEKKKELNFPVHATLSFAEGFLRYWSQPKITDRLGGPSAVVGSSSHKGGEEEEGRKEEEKKERRSARAEAAEIVTSLIPSPDAWISSLVGETPLLDLALQQVSTAYIIICIHF